MCGLPSNSPILFVVAVIIGAVVLIVRRLSRKLRGGTDPQGVSLYSAASPWEERRAQRTRRSRRRKDSRRKNRRRENSRRENRIKIKTNMGGQDTQTAKTGLCPAFLWRILIVIIHSNNLRMPETVFPPGFRKSGRFSVACQHHIYPGKGEPHAAYLSAHPQF